MNRSIPSSGVTTSFSTTTAYFYRSSELSGPAAGALRRHPTRPVAWPPAAAPRPVTSARPAALPPAAAPPVTSGARPALCLPPPAPPVTSARPVALPPAAAPPVTSARPVACLPPPRHLSRRRARSLCLPPRQLLRSLHHLSRSCPPIGRAFPRPPILPLPTATSPCSLSDFGADTSELHSIFARLLTPKDPSTLHKSQWLSYTRIFSIVQPYAPGRVWKHGRGNLMQLLIQWCQQQPLAGRKQSTWCA